jgi:hypothetical protein
MELNSYFKDFLAEIRPQQNHREEYKTGHRTLRKRLLEDDDLSPKIVNTFLQGSYRRATAIRPRAGKRADVDVVVVTTLHQNDYTPDHAMDLFTPFLEKHYKDKYTRQGRSIAIGLSYIDLDLVITSAPSETERVAFKSASVSGEETPEDVNDWRLVPAWIGLAQRSLPEARRSLELARKQAEWQLSPLYIPDREANCWEPTHPLEQIQWTWDKNRACDGHYVNVVKAIKWARRVNYETPKYPKGYPLEHIIGFCCPNDINSVAEGVTLTLESITSQFAAYAASKQVPVLQDHGVPEHNVLHRIIGEDFALFHKQVSDDAKIARRALDATTVKSSADAWRELFGSYFPKAPEDDDRDGGDDGGSSSKSSGGFTPRTSSSAIGGGRYA